MLFYCIPSGKHSGSLWVEGGMVLDDDRLVSCSQDLINLRKLMDIRLRDCNPTRCGLESFVV